MQCTHCRSTNSVQYKCAKCESAFYCNRTCQVADWDLAHSAFCFGNDANSAKKIGMPAGEKRRLPKDENHDDGDEEKVLEDDVPPTSSCPPPRTNLSTWEVELLLDNADKLDWRTYAQLNPAILRLVQEKFARLPENKRRDLRHAWVSIPRLFVPAPNNRLRWKDDISEPAVIETLVMHSNVESLEQLRRYSMLTDKPVRNQFLLGFIRTAVYNDAFEVLVYLHNKTGATKTDITVFYLNMAVEKGGVETWRIFHDVYGIGKDELLASRAINLAAQHERKDVLRLMRDLYGVNGADVVSARPFYYGRRVLAVEMLEFLRVEFALVPGNPESYILRQMRLLETIAQEDGHADVLAWVHQHFP
jgi:hypothetical protein